MSKMKHEVPHISYLDAGIAGMVVFNHKLGNQATICAIHHCMAYGVFVPRRNAMRRLPRSCRRR